MSPIRTNAAFTAPAPVRTRSAVIVQDLPLTDAAMIAEHGRFDDLEHQFRELFEGPERIEDDNAREGPIDTIRRRQQTVLNRMAKRQAQTWAGIAARYRTLMLYDTELRPAERALDPGEYESRRLLAILLRDLGVVLEAEGLLDQPERL